MSVTLSKSIDLPNNHPPTLDQAVTAKHLSLTSDRSEYAPLSSAYIKIPKIGYLHGNESFLSFSVKYSGTVGAGGSINLDTCAYALIRGIELTHGTETLVNQSQDCGRSWVTLRDFSSDGSPSDSIGLGADATDRSKGHSITSGSTYNYSFCMPVSLLGSLSSGTACPLGWLQGGDLTLKITWSGVGDAIYVSGATAASNLSFTVSDVVYNAKISQLDNSVDMALRAAYGPDMPVVVPSQEISIQSGIAQSGVGSVNQQITLPYSSCKGVMWWLTNSAVANGTFNANKSGRATSTRTIGVLKDTYVNVAGQQVPQGGIKAQKVGTNALIAFNQGVVYGYVQQFMNSLSSAAPNALVPISQFSSADTEIANIAGVHANNRGVCALDFDRSDVDQSQIYMGVNTSNSQCSITMNFSTALAESHNFYTLALYDCSFVLENGQMRRVV